MTETIIEGRPKLPAPEEYLALPAPEGHAAAADGDAEDGDGREHQGDRRPWWRRRLLWLGLATLLLIALLVLLLGGDDGEGGAEQQGGGRPVESVSASRARSVNWTGELTAIGTVDAIQGVDVTTEVAGVVAEIAFRNGTSARAGETLVRLDTTTERAQRAALIAQRDRARLAYDRALRLIARGAIAQAEVEEARAEWQNLAAQVNQVETIIEKKRIDAPFSGTLGIRQVSLGQYVAPGTAVVTLQQLSPVFVNFELPERTFSDTREGLRVQMTSDAFPGRTFDGRVTAIDPQVAQGTRNYTVQATVPNSGRMLRPGMFADVTIRLPGSRTVTVVPSTAIARNAYGDIVYIVDRLGPEEQRRRQRQARQQGEQDDGGFLSSLFGGSEEGDSQPKQDSEAGPQLVARSMFIEVGETRGLYTEITRGIRPGMRVITAGQLKVDNGAPIRLVERDALRGAEPVPKGP